MSWRTVLDLEDEASLAVAGIDAADLPARGAEMSYPGLHVDETGTAHITYSYLRDAIKYVRVPAGVWDR
jgi:predicted neuraminidase